MTLVKRVVSQYGVERMEPVLGMKGQEDVQVTPPIKHNCVTDGHLYASTSGGLQLLGLSNGDCISCRKSKKEIVTETLQFAVRTSAKSYDPSGTSGEATHFNRDDYRHPPEAYGHDESREGTNAYMNNHQLRMDNDRLREQLAQARIRLQKSQDLVDEQARELSCLESRCEAHAKTIAVMRQERGPGIQHKPAEPTQTCHMGDYYED